MEELDGKVFDEICSQKIDPLPIWFTLITNFIYIILNSIYMYYTVDVEDQQENLLENNKSSKKSFKQVLSSIFLHLIRFSKLFVTIFLFYHEMSLVHQSKTQGFFKYDCFVFQIINSNNFRDIFFYFFGYMIIYQNEQKTYLQKLNKALGFSLYGEHKEEHKKLLIRQGYPILIIHALYVCLMIPISLTHIVPAIIIFLPFTIVLAIQIIILKWLTSRFMGSRANFLNTFLFSYIIFIMLSYFTFNLMVNFVILFYYKVPWDQSIIQFFDYLTENNNIQQIITNNLQETQHYWFVLIRCIY